LLQLRITPEHFISLVTVCYIDYHMRIFPHFSFSSTNLHCCKRKSCSFKEWNLPNSVFSSGNAIFDIQQQFKFIFQHSTKQSGTSKNIFVTYIINPSQHIQLS